MSIGEYLQVPIFQRALLAALVAGGTVSLLGVVIVMLNLTTMRFALMHMALLGGAAGLAFGASPLAGATAAIVLGSLFLGPFSERLRLDAGITGAFFMTGSIALAFVLFYKAGVPALDVFGLFTGSLLSLSRDDLLAVAGLGAAILLVYACLFREIQLVFYDPEQAEWLGVPAKRIKNALLFLTGLSIGVAMKVVGALLIDALILIPAMTAMRLSRSLLQILVLSSFFGTAAAAGGLLISMALDMPSGAAITLTGVCLLGLSVFIRR
ncbi:MAG: metal ABC transporter permease [Peptococcaceae bacterium]|nr:metal ABC transporter permease [Peptococcaceae bacterium]